MDVLVLVEDDAIQGAFEFPASVEAREHAVDLAGAHFFGGFCAIGGGADLPPKIAGAGQQNRHCYIQLRQILRAVFKVTGISEFDQTMTNFATSQLIIISEGQDTSLEFSKAYNMLSKTERIHFLGFGYNDLSLRRLKVNTLTPEIMDGTAFGLGDAEVEEIMHTTKIKLQDNKSDALELLKKYVRF